MKPNMAVNDTQLIPETHGNQSRVETKSKWKELTENKDCSERNACLTLGDHCANQYTINKLCEHIMKQ